MTTYWATECDHCHRVDKQESQRAGPPPRWLVLHNHVRPDDFILHFCGLGCLGQYVDQVRPATTEVPPVP